MQSSQTDLKMKFSRPVKGQRRRVLLLLPVLFAAILVLFPFDWLGTIWPAYAQLFDRVFATVLAHEIGHATVFFMAGLLILLAFPRLLRRPTLYLALMAIGALGEEVLQSLFKLSLPDIWDSRDLLLDLSGFVLAYGLARLCVSLAQLRPSR
jgi:hypothetical protein